MESGYRIVQECPAAFSPDYNLFLFHRQEHLKLQAESWVNYFLVRQVNQKVMAQVSFYVHDGKARTPVKAPFGSYLFSPRLSPQGLYDFVHQCELLLKKKGVNKVTLTEPPLYYRESGEMLHTILFNQGYQVTNAELSSGIRVGHVSFEDKIESWEKRKLRLAKAKGITCRHLAISHLEDVYGFIEKCRKQRGTSLSMTLEELARVVEKFKSEFVLFGAFLNKEMAAASIAIRVHPGILYNFYSGHLKKFDTISPMVILTGSLFKFCSANQIGLLDLGTSAIEGQPNFSLLDFKLRLGGAPSMKLTFEKNLL